MPLAVPYRRNLEPRKLTVVTPNDQEAWQGLWKYDLYSRWGIPDSACDDLINMVPQGRSMRQIPGNSATIATLPAALVWSSAQILNGGVYIFCLCSDQNLYQVSVGGVVTKINGATAISSKADIANWRGTLIIISDVNVSRMYSWNGTTFTTLTAWNGTPASYIAVYGDMLWAANGSTITHSDIDNYASLGGLSAAFTITEGDCANPVLAMVPFTGLLYLFGSNWVQVLGNVQSITNNNVTQLVFTRGTLTSQVGIFSKWGIVPYGLDLYFANAYGIWKMSGGAPELISERIGGFMQSLAAGSTLSGAYGQVYGNPVLCWHGQWSQDNAYTVFCYLPNQRQWFRQSIGTNTFITGITSSAITNNNPTIWGCDGTNLFSLFSNAGASVTSTVKTKLFNMGSPISYVQAHKAGAAIIYTGSTSVTITPVNNDNQQQAALSKTQSFSPTAATWVNKFGQTVSWVNNSSSTVSWVGASAQQYDVVQADVPLMDRCFGFDMTLTGSGVTLHSIPMEVEESPSAWG
jgi:hypothetical protein